MRKKILVLTAMLVLVCSTAFAYVGNTRTGKFHRDGCRKDFSISHPVSNGPVQRLLC